MTPYIRAALGSIETYGTVGISFRLGEDLGNDYGSPRVRPALSGPGSFNNIVGFSWYVFGRVAGRAVARDLFVEGNIIKDSPGVEFLISQLDLQAGVALQMGRIAGIHARCSVTAASQIKIAVAVLALLTYGHVSKANEQPRSAAILEQLVAPVFASPS